MKQLLLAFIILCSHNCFAQNNADAIIGKWLKVPKEDLIIEVYKSGEQYQGKITWTKTKDPNRPIDFMILDKLKYNSNSGVWEDGKINDPGSGRTYTASVKLKPDGMLELTGYMGFKFFGKKKNFKKVK